MPIRVAIDHSKCCGYGICAEICPEVFDVGANGLGVVTTEVVDSEVAEAVREAVESCPELAIEVTE